MTTSTGKRHEGLHREDAGTVDSEGFIAPSVGAVEHALYFTSAPDVLAKTMQVIDEQRLELPGAVIVWDETIGRRKGAKAVPGSWWAGNGSLTMSLVFRGVASEDAPARVQAVTAATVDAIASFAPRELVSHDGAGILILDGRRVGMIQHQAYSGTDIFVIRVNGNTDFSNAPAGVQENNSRLIDYIDPNSLPLGKPGTLPNTLALKLMEDVPRAVAGSGRGEA